MSASTTQARRGIRGERLTVLTVLLGMLLSLVAVLATAQPAFADTPLVGLDQPTCNAAGYPEDNKTNTGDGETGVGSTGDWGSILKTAEKEATATVNPGYSVDVCVKTGGGNTGESVYEYTDLACASDAVDPCTFALPMSADEYDHGVSHVSWDNAVEDLDLCNPDDRPSGMSIDEWLSAEETQSEGEFDRSDCFDIEITDTCGSFNATVTHDTGYDYRFRWVEGDTKAVNPDTDGEDGDNAMSAEFAEDYSDGEVQLTYYIVGPEKDYLVGTDIPNWWDGGATTTVDTDCEPPSSSPLISLVKDAVVGEGSDLIDVDGPNPLLQFSDTDQGPKTALYSYLIKNEGDEALVNISLLDDRIAGADLDFSDCTAKEPLAPGDTCTATGSEDFTLADAQADEDGLITNTGTVEAEGEESGDDVSASDPATIALAVVFSEVQEKEDPKPAPAVESAAEEKPAPAVESAAEELPATGLDDQGLLPVALLLIALGAAILWLDRPWVGVR